MTMPERCPSCDGGEAYTIGTLSPHLEDAFPCPKCGWVLPDGTALGAGWAKNPFPERE